MLVLIEVWLWQSGLEYGAFVFLWAFLLELITLHTSGAMSHPERIEFFRSHPWLTHTLIRVPSIHEHPGHTHLLVFEFRRFLWASEWLHGVVEVRIGGIELALLKRYSGSSHLTSLLGPTPLIDIFIDELQTKVLVLPDRFAISRSFCSKRGIHWSSSWL